jgi:SAM-dependent methyltransferase
MSLVNPTVEQTSERFRHASQYYTTGRPTYPALLIERVADLIGLRRTDRVLDLGTGPGFLAIDFAPRAGDVTAIDPSADMLGVARANAARAGVDISFVQASSYDLDAGFGQFRLVSIGRAFHWMDREDTLRRLEGLVEPDGAVVLFSDRSPDVPANAWRGAYRAVLEKYSANDPLGAASRAALPSHEAVLLGSRFDVLERHAVLERRATAVERFVDRLLSVGAAWTGADPLRVQDVAGEIRAALAPFAADGVIHEVVEGGALIARRSGR